MRKRNSLIIAVLASVGILASAGLSASAHTRSVETCVLLAGEGITTGANSEIDGNICAGAAITTGAGTKVEGTLIAGAAVTTGAGTSVTGGGLKGSLSAGATITTGAGTVVAKDLRAGGALVLGASTTARSQYASLSTSPVTHVNSHLEDDLRGSRNQMTESAQDLGVLQLPANTDIEIATELGGKTLTAGVYSTDTYFTLTGILTLYGNKDSIFVIRSAGYISAAAGSSVVLAGGVLAKNVFFVTGSYFSAGAGSDFSGNVLATTYATLGAGSKFDGTIFSRDSYITLGADVVLD
jgi:hypothetical protein